MPVYISPPPRGPLTRIISGIIAVFLLVGAFTIGIAAFLVIAGIGLIAGIALWIRVAWIKRKLRKSGVDLNMRADEPPQSGRIIDAEYTVISDRGDQNET